jgi:hypothetical protein
MSWMPEADYLEPAGGLLREVMDAHGGFAAWNGAKAVRTVMSTGGALFLMRTTRDAFHQTEVIVDLHSPRTEIRDFPRGGQTGFFTPSRVWIEDRDGRVLAERDEPRASFSKMRKQLHWDHLDSVYFSGYAVWNYISAPYLLCRGDVIIEEGASCVDKGRTWRGLTATFPEYLPTHNAKQVLYFDERARLRRHDYHAEVIGPYAVASHYCEDHLKFGKAVFPTRRRVVPRMGNGRTLPFPTLVWIRVHEAALQSSSRS